MSSQNRPFSQSDVPILSISEQTSQKTQRLWHLQRQIAFLDHRLVRLRLLSERWSWVRVALFVITLLGSSAVFYLATANWFSFTLIAGLILFGMAVRIHRFWDQSTVKHEGWRQIKATHMARMTLNWAHLPTLHSPKKKTDHPFAHDLDLVGDISLHRLLDTTVSLEGSERLRTWLTEPHPNQMLILERQRLVRELTPLSLFRDKLTLHAHLATKHPKKPLTAPILAWLEAIHKPASSLLPWLLVSSGLALLNGVLFLLDQLAILPPLWQLTGGIYLLLFVLKLREIGPLFNEALALRDQIQQFLAVFQHLEEWRYEHTPHLKQLCAPFIEPTQRPSSYLKRIASVVNATGLRGNPLMWLLLNILVPWDFYFAYRLKQHQAAIAEHLPHWLDIWFELEALSALGTFAYLNPDYTFPEITSQTSEPPFLFQALKLGHPLIPDESKVCNDFTFQHLGDVGIITGSNMAGKSSFLRALGMNLALAYAGGVVNAQQLTTIPFRLFTSIAVNDSVTDGISFFYAEVKRLRALLDALESDDPLPLFFLIDEIFRGTNNRERLIGSRAYIQALVSQSGVGLISTHDLELVKLADEESQITNYHFREQISDNQMIFDYTLRLGPCPTTNALKIMELAGLPVS